MGYDMDGAPQRPGPSPPSARNGAGNLSHRARGVIAAAAATGPAGNATQNFVKLIERTQDSLVATTDTDLEDARRTLLQVRKEYDTVHHKAEQKEVQLKHLREEIRAADNLHMRQGDDTHLLDDKAGQLEKQLNETLKLIHSTKESRGVYEHMLARIQKEQAILKQKMLIMEEHMGRKKREVQQKQNESERINQGKVASERQLARLAEDATAERETCSVAYKVMDGELQRRKDANKRRADFESWRHEVALEAANEAFNASAGRLRKLYAIEKLAGNCLQKITFEQVERAEATENGFQKIREVTGLADVMDIVHKFLNRDVEHDQLRASVKEAEVRLEALTQDFTDFKRDTEGITFDQASLGTGDVYKHIEQHERGLNEAFEEHEACRMRLQKTTIQIEHTKRWAARVGQWLAKYEDCPKVEGPEHLAQFFRKLDVATRAFVEDVSRQIRERKMTRGEMVKRRGKEHHEQEKLLKDSHFLRGPNNRMRADADNFAAAGASGRPSSRQGSAEEDPAGAFAEDRERYRQESDELFRAKMAEQQKKEQGQKKEQNQKKEGRP